MSTSSKIHTNQTSILARKIAKLHQVPLKDLSTEIIKILNYINNLNITYNEHNTHKTILLTGHSVIDHWIMLSTVIEGRQVDELVDKSSRCIRGFFIENDLAGDSVIMYDGNDKSLRALVTELQFDGYNLLDVGSNFVYAL